MADLKYYDIILKPVVTEKSMSGMGDKKYTFLVNPDATKSKHNELQRQKQETWQCIWQDCRDKESYR